MGSLYTSTHRDLFQGLCKVLYLIPVLTLLILLAALQTLFFSPPAPHYAHLRRLQSAESALSHGVHQQPGRRGRGRGIPHAPSGKKSQVRAVYLAISARKIGLFCCCCSVYLVLRGKEGRSCWIWTPHT